MGSSGYGIFGNYPGGNAEFGDGNGGIGDRIECPSLIENIRLEDVTNSEYYQKNKTLPKNNELVNLCKNIHNGRLVVQISSSQEILGNIPTQYNFLINCIKKDIQYTGKIISAGDRPIPHVVVTLND